jgi:hypothetical protein
MFEKTLGARVGARAAALRGGSGLPTNREMAQIGLVLLGLGAIAFLFFAWLMLSDSHRAKLSSLGSGADCESLGRGGLYCAKQPANAGVDPDGDCASLGKGGRVCAEHFPNGGDSNP